MQSFTRLVDSLWANVAADSKPEFWLKILAFSVTWTIGIMFKGRTISFSLFLT